MSCTVLRLSRKNHQPKIPPKIGSSIPITLAVDALNLCRPRKTRKYGTTVPMLINQRTSKKPITKCTELKNLIIAQNSNCLIEIDGGVNEVTAPKLLNCGADVLVAGNYVFSSKAPLTTIDSLKSLSKNTVNA